MRTTSIEYISSYNEKIQNTIDWITLHGLEDTVTAGFIPDSSTGVKEVTAHSILELESILDFGKHKGKMIEDVIVDNPGYMEWMADNDVREFSEEVMELLSKEGII